MEDMKKSSLAMAYGMKRRARKMAEGGMLGVNGTDRAMNAGSGGVSEAGADVRREKYGYAHGDAKAKHKKVLAEIMAMKGQDRSNLADGGMIEEIMKKRGCYSEGGKVANEDETEADLEPNEFDDLALEDDLDFSYSGESSGDEDSDGDVISKIMRKRSKA